MNNTEIKAQSLQFHSVAGVDIPNPETAEPGKRKRRRLTAEYKLRILKEADLCSEDRGALGALLRREGLYASSLSVWREQRDSGALSGLCEKRGRKSHQKKTTSQEELESLAKKYAQLEKRYQQSLLIIEAQKKISDLLGIAMADTSALDT